MKKVVTVEANTVEDAIQQALEILELRREQVNVEILTNPARRLMGLRKVMAEVKVAKAEYSEDKQSVARPLSKIEELAGLLDEIDMKAIITSSFQPEHKVTQEPSTTESNRQLSSARIHNGDIQFQFVGDSLPSIIPNDRAIITRNGEVLTEPVLIQPEDKVEVTIQDVIVASKFTIQLMEDDMIALLSFTPGKQIKRSLVDTIWSSRLAIRVEETIEYTNDLQPQTIVNELQAMGVQHGILFPAIKKVTEVDKPYELIVAKGILPVMGTDGDLEVHIHYEEFDPNSEGKVDFREMNAITNVQEGQVIATHIVPVPGTPGKNLLGRTIPVKPVRDIVLRPGKNIKKVQEDLVTLISGKPVLDRRGQFVKIDVNNEFIHPGEVNLESGNIRFEGDVRIGGNILPSMFVGATGGVFVIGSMTKAEIHATKQVIVKGNVLSSTINVGKQEAAVNELVVLIKSVTEILIQIKEAVNQIFIIRGREELELSPSELKRLIYLLMEKRYAQFEDLNKTFIVKVREQNDKIDEEWLSVANRLYAIFINPLNEHLQSMKEFERLIEDAYILTQLYAKENSPQTKLIIPYAVNSKLYSSGHIEVISKGIYHSDLTADETIRIKGVCRGGEIYARREVAMQEAGSENPVKTVVRTSAEGRIKIGAVYAGTEIYVGTRKYIFSKYATNITAQLDAEGELDLG
ncbi:FapA family protein [Sporosarcina sp. P18a]|uniref:flagellar assembly protein A n=1 Tax=Sporosarcina sp. P18a TaxID=2048259 RepID=UPI0013041A1D|nr:FapA family protein [Sporosarcina sp. P18a]